MPMPKLGIYKITNKINGKIYIGSSNNFIRRKRQHISELKNIKHENPYLQKAWDKYGEKVFQWEVVEVIENPKDLIDREQFWMEKLSVCNRSLGYNIRPRADQRCHSEETKRKIGISNSIALKGRKLSRELKDKLKIAVKKRYLNSPMREETKKKISENHAKHWLGQKFSKEIKQKISLALKDFYKNNSRKPISEQTRQKFIEAKRKNFKPVLQYSLDGNFLREFESIASIQRLCGFNAKCIQGICKEKRKQVYGFQWKYKNLNEVCHAPTIAA